MARTFYPRPKCYEPPMARFEAQYIPEPNSGCWIWIGTVAGSKKNERPKIWVEGKSRPAHRFSYEKLVGAIPDQTMICHRCNNILCVNPEHLYAGSAQQNTDDMMRAGRHFSQSNPGAVASLKVRALQNAKAKLAKPTCSKGHVLDADNMYAHPTGRRVCKTCRVVWKRNFRARQKGIVQ